MQVFLGHSGGLDTDGNELPRLVYVSREKRPGFQHHKKAGAMNALVCHTNTYFMCLIALSGLYFLLMDVSCPVSCLVSTKPMALVWQLVFLTRLCKKTESTWKITYNMVL